MSKEVLQLLQLAELGDVNAIDQLQPHLHHRRLLLLLLLLLQQRLAEYCDHGQHGGDQLKELGAEFHSQLLQLLLLPQ